MIIDLGRDAEKIGDEVISARVLNFGLDHNVVDEICSMAKETRRGRIRLCIHRDSSEQQQEMLIVHPYHAYVPPHKHLAKPESLLVLRGSADYFLFDDGGKIKERIELGDQCSGKCFFFRISEPGYHSLLIKSDMLVFLEITQGPFYQSDNVVAPWAPSPDDCDAIDRFFGLLNASGDS